MKRPRRRSQLRIFLGGIYFFCIKNIQWFCLGKRLARTRQTTDLPYQIFTHQTILLRPLKDVEMWMQHNKVQNLRLAIKKLDGLIIKPQEIFSYWSLIGQTTKAKGYMPGMVLHNGGFRSGIGGGLCQLSNLIYWMTLHTPLSVVERWRHSYDVFPDAGRTQPFGSGATCSYPNIDLQIKNETQSTFQLRLEITKTHLVGRWLSSQPATTRYEVEERDHVIRHEEWGGYIRHNQIFKIAYDLESGEKLTEQLVAVNNAIMMYSPLLEDSRAEV